MWRSVILFVAAMYLGSAAVYGRQAVQPPPFSQAGNPVAANRARDCSIRADDLRAANPSEGQAAREPEEHFDPGDASGNNDGDPPAVHLDLDLRVLEQVESELAPCVLPADPQAPAQDFRSACSAELLANFEMRRDGEPERDIPIGRLPGSPAFFYESGMSIDADGAPNAYNPDNSGLDDLANAGAPGMWQGLAKNTDGQPFIQGPDDPFPGFYVSATALADRSKAVSDPTRYVDASKIPFIVLPGRLARELGARPGDFAAVFNQRNAKSSYAIFGDIGPFDRIGEGSVALAENLGVRPDARNGGARRGILYLVFPGSGNGRPRTVEEINAEAEKLLQAWESTSFAEACADRRVDPAGERNPAAN